MSISDEQLRKELVENGKSLECVSEEYDVSIGSLSERKNKLGIKSLQKLNNGRSLWLPEGAMDRLPIDDPSNAFWEFVDDPEDADVFISFSDVKWKQ